MTKEEERTHTGCQTYTDPDMSMYVRSDTASGQTGVWSEGAHHASGTGAATAKTRDPGTTLDRDTDYEAKRGAYGVRCNLRLNSPTISIERSEWCSGRPREDADDRNTRTRGQEDMDRAGHIWIWTPHTVHGREPVSRPRPAGWILTVCTCTRTYTSW